MRKGVLIFLVILLSHTLSANGAEKSTSAKDFYKNRPVTLLCNAKPGGGTDYGARLIAAHWNRVTGGRMIVKNDPGGGSIAAINRVYNSKPDGRLIGTAVLGAHIITLPLFETPGVMYDPKKFTYLGHFAPEPYSIAVGKNSPYASINDLRQAKKLVFGAPDPSSTPASGAAILFNFFGLNGKTVPSFLGPELGLAAAKGEIDGYSIHGSGLTAALKKGFIKRPLVTLDFKRSPYFSDVPAIVEVMDLDPGQKKILTIFSTMTTGKVFYAPPGIPKDRADYLRNSFDRIVQSEAFVKQAKMRWKFWSPHTPGAEVSQLVSEVMVIPKEDIVKFKRFTKRYSD